MKQPLVLMILDGFGINPADYGNAIHAAKKPNLDRYFASYPHTRLGASGLDVGLPDGQMGNSEVGHTNIGAGRIVYQELTRITKSIQDGDFFTNEALTGAIENCHKHNSALHLMGLLSDGGVHSHIEHLFGLLELAKKSGLTKVYVHCFMDGRDVPPSSGKDFILQLQNKLDELGIGKIASVMGRYYAMDRDNRWERVEKAYDALVLGKGVLCEDAAKAVENSYAQEVTDEFIASGFGRLKILSMVGAMSASLPSCSLQSAYCLLMTKNGTGLVVCAVNGEPSSSYIRSALPWSAVSRTVPSIDRTFSTTLPTQLSTASTA